MVKGEYYINQKGKIRIDEIVGYGSKKITREVIGVTEGEKFIFKTVFNF